MRRMNSVAWISSREFMTHACHEVNEIKELKEVNVVQHLKGVNDIDETNDLNGIDEIGAIGQATHRVQSISPNSSVVLTYSSAD